MQNKGHQIHEWITKQRLKIHKENKQALQNIHQQPHEHLRRSVLKKRQDEDEHQKGMKDSKLLHQIKRKHIVRSRQGTLNESFVSQDKKHHIIRQIKEWINIIQTTLKEQGSLIENNLSKLQNSLYKWCLFLQQSSLPSSESIETPLISARTTHSILSGSDKFPQEQNQKFKQQKDYYQKQIKRLSTKLKDCQIELQVNYFNSHQSLGKIQELYALFIQCKTIIKKGQDKNQQNNELMSRILNEADDFLKELQQLIPSAINSQKITEKIQKKLVHLKEYRQVFNLIK